MKFFKRIFLLTTMISAGFAAGAQEHFTTHDKEIIGAKKDGIMRLWKVTDRSDSLFLRKKTMPVTPEMMRSRKMDVLKHRMLLTVNDHSNPGVGIAAPQVGLPYRFIAVQRLDKEGEPFEFYANIYITAYGEETALGSEGCLSVPDRSGEVRRSTSVGISYTDPVTYKTVTENITGFTAVIFQHEVDHLDGVLYTDRIEAGKKTRVIEYEPQGVCSKKMKIILDGDRVADLEVTGGCRGNSLGIAALVRGMKIDEAIRRLEGIKCGRRDTSCPDQFVRALKENK